MDVGQQLAILERQVADLRRELAALKDRSASTDDMARVGDVFHAREFAPQSEMLSANVAFSGTAYVRGKKFTGLKSDATLPWIKVDVSAVTAAEAAGPPSNPFANNEEWFLKSATAGDIHVTRF